MRPAWRFIGLLGLAVLLIGGAPSVRRSVGGAVPADHPRAALIPFENLTGREAQSALFGQIFFAQLVATGAFEMIEPGRVDEVLDSVGVRGGVALSPAQIQAIGGMLHAPYLILGSVLESGRVQSSGVDLPAVGATLRVVEADSGRVVWAGVHFRSGEDHESLFGWGRVQSTEKLISALASDMLADFRNAGARRARKAGTEGSR